MSTFMFVPFVPLSPRKKNTQARSRITTTSTMAIMAPDPPPPPPLEAGGGEDPGLF